MKRNLPTHPVYLLVFWVTIYLLSFSSAKCQTVLESNASNDSPGSGESGFSLPNSLSGTLQGADQDYWDIPDGTLGTYQVFDMFNVNFLYGSLDLELRSYTNAERTEGEVIRLLSESDTFSLSASRYYSLRVSSNSENPGINIPTAVSTYQDLRSLLQSISDEIQGIRNILPTNAIIIRFLLNNLQAFLELQLDNLPNNDADLPGNIAAFINQILNIDAISNFVADFYTVTLVQAASNSSGLLPVVWLDFQAERTNNQVELLWLTASEQNNRGFAIEYSQDAESWQEVGFVEGKGTSSVVNAYSFLHSPPNSGYTYYRLKQVDYNGDFEYSSIQEIVMGNASHAARFQVYPNPVSDVLYIQSQVGQIVLRDLTGKLLHSEKVTVMGIQLPMDNFSPGIYLLELFTTSGERQTLRIQVSDTF